MLERFPIGAQRAVIVDTTGHVCPMSLHHFAACGLLEIKNIERLGRVRNDVGGFWNGLRQQVALKIGGDSSERGDVGTCRKKFEKFPPSGVSYTRILHD